MNYEDKLKKIDFFKIHPSYIPFIGDKYEQYRILHIAESHYINQNKENERYGIEYFSDKWWKESCEEMLDELNCLEYVNTQRVIEKYMTDVKSRSYSLFSNMSKSFSKIVLEKEIINITEEDKQIYDYFSFMNFFQMPSLYEGKKYWNSLLNSSKLCGKRPLASEVWRETVKISIETVDNVIDILEPKAIVFTSISAWKEYEKTGKYAKDNRIIHTSHPGMPYTWYKKLSSLDYKTGVEVFEEGLKRIYMN